MENNKIIVIKVDIFFNLLLFVNIILINNEFVELNFRFFEEIFLEFLYFGGNKLCEILIL